VMTVFAGGALAIGVAIWSLIMGLLDMQGMSTEQGLGKVAAKIKPKLPYGFAFAIGAIIAYPQSWWLTAAHGGAL
jgi:Flp pilus assembly protein protease CpaA